MPIVDDGLPIDEVGEWALEKHERLRKYIEITRHARRKYVDGPSKTASYIDPFCGLERQWSGMRSALFKMLQDTGDQRLVATCLGPVDRFLLGTRRRQSVVGVVFNHMISSM